MSKPARGATNGEFARYLEREDPATPVDEWPDRFEHFREHGEVPD